MHKYPQSIDRIGINYYYYFSASLIFFQASSNVARKIYSKPAITRMITSETRRNDGAESLKSIRLET